jgi:hypothetical protein
VGPTAACPGLSLLAEATAAVPRISFPVVHSIAAFPALVSVAAVAASVVAIVAIPGYLATGVSPVVALGD